MERIRRLHERAKETGAYDVCLGTFLLVLFWYQLDEHRLAAWLAGHTNLAGRALAWSALGVRFAGGFLLLAALPALWSWLAHGRPPARLGWRLGNWRLWLPITAGAALLLTPLLYLNAGSPAFQARYPLLRPGPWTWASFLAWEATYLVYYLGWEGFFRGFWLLGLRHEIGLWPALLLQTAVSTVYHVGVPEAETLAALPAGLAFGGLALASESILPVILLHWYVGAATDLFCLLR